MASSSTDENFDIEVALSGPYHFGTVERIIRDLGPLFSITERARVRMDLRRLSFISPAGLTLLTAAVRRADDLGLLADGSTMLLPQASGVYRYLMRMDFMKQLFGDDEPEPFARRPAVGFRECRHFDSLENYPSVRKELVDSITERCETDPVASGSLHVALDEVCENVVHHAGTGHGGFAAAQALTSKPVMELAIADLGIGIRASLIKNPDYQHVEGDCEAIKTALRPRVTSTPERNAGIGLFVTSLLLVMNGGEVLVRSGYGAVFQGARNSTHVREAHLPGTLVVLRVRTDRGLDVNEVYRKLAQIEESDEDADNGDHDHASS